MVFLSPYVLLSKKEILQVLFSPLIFGTRGSDGKKEEKERIVNHFLRILEG
jgi:hypothetical protein